MITDDEYETHMERLRSGVRLIGVGHCAGTRADRLRVGDVLMWNYGAMTTVDAIETASPEYLRLTLRASDDQRVSTRRVKRTRYVVLTDGRRIVTRPSDAP